MTSRLRLLLLATALTPGLVQATVLEFDSNWLVRLDGHYYSVEAGQVDVSENGVALGTLAVSLSNCRRTSGAGQIETDRLLSFAGGNDVYLDALTTEHPIWFEEGTAVLVLASATSDVICDGEQLPPGTPENVFDDHFEELE